MFLGMCLDMFLSMSGVFLDEFLPCLGMFLDVLGHVKACSWEYLGVFLDMSRRVPVCLGISRHVPGHVYDVPGRVKVCCCSCLGMSRCVPGISGHVSGNVLLGESNSSSMLQIRGCFRRSGVNVWGGHRAQMWMCITWGSTKAHRGSWWD